MARGPKTIKIKDDENVLETEVTLWVDRDGELEVGISDENLRDTFPIAVAIDISNAIQNLTKWSNTKEGKKKIAECQALEEVDYNRYVLKRPPAKKARKKR